MLPQRLAADCWDFEVIRLKSAASGTIPPGGVAPLNWLFAPLEAVQYAVQVPVQLGDGRVEVITLQVRLCLPCNLYFSSETGIERCLCLAVGCARRARCGSSPAGLRR